MFTRMAGLVVMVAVGALFVLALVAAALVLWLTGRGDPPRREE
jgi:hypothetical protein